MRKLKMPSPAMVVSLIALFVALGGTGYAARNAILSSPAKAQIVKIVNNTVTKPLPSGHSESGNFGGGGGDTTDDWIGLSITYPRPLAHPISDKHIVDVSGSSAPHCAGKGHAAPGYLCFYDSIQSGVDPGTDFYSTDSDALGKLGVVGYWKVNSDGAHPYIGGSWTVTAP